MIWNEKGRQKTLCDPFNSKYLFGYYTHVRNIAHKNSFIGKKMNYRKKWCTDIYVSLL